MTKTTLKELAIKITLTMNGPAKRAWELQDEWQRNSNSYRCMLRYQGRSYSFDFWQGTGMSSDPEAEGVLDCLLSDANAGDDSFEDFCGNMGYDTDSRKAEKLWKQCQQIKTRMKQLLGDDYEAFLYADRD